jgi:HAD superfamily phosphatase (TIGR01668 family)
MPIYKKCIPFAYYASIFEIPYQNLKEQGVKSLFFDLDNTIIGYDENELSKKHLDFFKKLSKNFNVLIISNSNYKRVYHAVKESGLPFIWYAKKPLKFGFKKALKMIGTSKDESVLIGDQLMTDIFGANRMGLKAILVQSVKRKSDRKITQFNRKIERIILKKIEKKSPQLYLERLSKYVNDHKM